MNRNLKGREHRIYKEGLGPLDRTQESVLLGTLLGDAYGGRNRTVNPSITFEQTTTRKDYVFHLYDIFGAYTGTGPKLHTDKRGYSSWRFTTYTHPAFQPLYDMFYKDGRKSVTTEVAERLDTCALAYWMQDDGSRGKNCYHLHTESFTMAEAELLKATLIWKFDLVVTINTDRRDGKEMPKLRIAKESLAHFNSLVEPFILPCLRYRLHDTSSS